MELPELATLDVFMELDGCEIVHSRVMFGMDPGMGLNPEVIWHGRSLSSTVRS
jgi:hypothetical protein